MVRGISYASAFLLLIVYSTVVTTGQTRNYAVETLGKLTATEQVTKDSLTESPASHSIFSGLGAALILSYQYFISSQDRPSCMFTRSCSRFALDAVKSKGLLVGTLFAADRLQRCDSFAEEYYHKDIQTGLAIDPMVEFLLHDGGENK